MGDRGESRGKQGEQGKPGSQGEVREDRELEGKRPDESHGARVARVK